MYKFSMSKYNRMFGIFHWAIVILAALFIAIAKLHAFSHPTEADFFPQLNCPEMAKEGKVNDERTDVQKHYEHCTGKPMPSSGSSSSSSKKSNPTSNDD